MSGVPVLWKEGKKHLKCKLPVRPTQDTILLENGVVKDWYFTNTVSAT